MNMSAAFDTHRYGCVQVDLQTGLLKVAEREFALSDRVGNRGNAMIIASFVGLMNTDLKRASVNTMTGLSSAPNPNSFRARLSQLRKKLDNFEIAKGVNANSLFLSDRLTGNQVDDNSDGLDKLPYHFNYRLANMIQLKGFYLVPDDLDGVRLNANQVLGPIQDKVAYRAGLG